MRQEDLEISDITPRQGGQQVTITQNTIKVLHKPTGIHAVSGYERSQHKNRTLAAAMVEYGLAHMGWQDL